MVTQLRGTPAPMYLIHDREGHPIGEVSAPRGEALIGRGAGTVLLLRPPVRRDGGTEIRRSA